MIFIAAHAYSTVIGVRLVFRIKQIPQSLCYYTFGAKCLGYMCIRKKSIFVLLKHVTSNHNQLSSLHMILQNGTENTSQCAKLYGIRLFRKYFVHKLLTQFIPTLLLTKRSLRDACPFTLFRNVCVHKSAFSIKNSPCMIMAASYRHSL